MSKLCECGQPSVMRNGACMRCAKLEGSSGHVSKPVKIKHINEIPYNIWARQEAERHGLTYNTFCDYMRLGVLKVQPADAARRGPTGRLIAIIKPNAVSVNVRPKS